MSMLPEPQTSLNRLEGDNTGALGLRQARYFPAIWGRSRRYSAAIAIRYLARGRSLFSGVLERGAARRRANSTDFDPCFFVEADESGLTLRLRLV